MKIEIPDELYKKLKEMSDNVKKQDNRSTEHPIFCVYEKKKVIALEDCGEEIGWIGEGCIVDEEDVKEELKEWRQEGPEDKRDDEDIINEELNYSQKVEFDIEDVPVSGQYYFTEKEAQRHIDLNHYHYKLPFTYVEGAWRNPEWETIRELLVLLGGGKNE